MKRARHAQHKCPQNGAPEENPTTEITTSTPVHLAQFVLNEAEKSLRLEAWIDMGRDTWGDIQTTLNHHIIQMRRAMAQLHDPGALRTILKSCRHPLPRRLATTRTDDQPILAALAAGDDDFDVRCIALTRINDPALRRQIARDIVLSLYPHTTQPRPAPETFCLSERDARRLRAIDAARDRLFQQACDYMLPDPDFKADDANCQNKEVLP